MCKFRLKFLSYIKKKKRKKKKEEDISPYLAYNKTRRKKVCNKRFRRSAQ